MNISGKKQVAGQAVCRQLFLSGKLKFQSVELIFIYFAKVRLKLISCLKKK